jgi:hypothetical protein
MTSRNEILLKAFLNRCSPEKQRRLERFLPESKKAALSQTPSFTQKITPEKSISSSLFDLVHWSWFLPTLKTYSEVEQIGFLSALPSSSALKLAQELQLAALPSPLTNVARSYFRALLERSLTLHKKDLLPLDYLPASPLNELLSLSQKKLIHLVNLLSLHDLAGELRQIVETKILKKIYSFLSEEERKRLKEISSYKDFFSVSRLPLDRWNGQEDSLRLLLHRRGLARLSLALAGQDPDLIWYVSHQFDIGRGTNLLTLCAKETTSERSESMVREIEELIRNYL